MPAEYDVFVSHAWADGDRPRQIADALRAAGLKVWFDATEIADFESITRAVEQGVAKSKALLAWYSKTYPTRRACQWELTAAFLAAQTEGDPRRRVLVVNPEAGADHIHPIELRDSRFCTAPATGDADAFQALAAAIAKHVADLSGPFADIHPLSAPVWYGMTGVGSTRFVGRLEELWGIHSLLHAGDVAVITGAAAASGGIAQVRGLGGVGKSLLAEEYALRFGAAYPGGVFWLRAYGNDDAKAGMGAVEREAERERQVQDFAARLGIEVRGKTPAEIEGALAREIEHRGKPCLWVVDDVPGALDGQALRRWFAPHALARTLATTRSREYGAQAKGIDLAVLPPDEAYQLLTSRRAPADEQEKEQARLLAEDLGRHALALDVAGAALASFGGGSPFRDFRAELARRDSDALELARMLADALPNGHETSIAQTLLRSIRNLGAEAQDFLRLASVLAVAPIPASLVTAVFEEADDRNHQEPEWRMRRAFHEVTAASLAEVAGAEGNARAVHTLVSRAMRFHGAAPERTRALRAAAVEALGSEIAAAAEDPRLHPRIEFHVAHAREAVSLPTSVPEANLLGWVACYDYERGAYASARALYSREVEFCRRVQGPAHSDTLTSMDNLAVTLRAQGDLAGATKLQEEALAVRRRVQGPEHPDTITSMGNLAVTLWAQGDLAGARKIEEEVLAVRRRALGPEHADTLQSMSNLAETLRAQGELGGARKLQEEALSVRRRVLGPEHPDTLKSMNNLAATLHVQGDLAGARKIEEESLALYRRVLGPEHPHTLTSMGNLASMLWAQGDLAGARKLEEETLAVRRRVLGPEHPNTSTSAWNLFGTLQDLGEHAAARQLLERDLVWLLERDPGTLGAKQREIRDMVAMAVKA